MPKAQVSQVIYKPDPMSTDEFLVIVNPETFTSWRNGDTTIPLADVVDSFHIYHSGQGNQGILGQVSKQQLDTVFGTHKEDEAVVKILQYGHLQAGTLKGNDNSGRAADSGANLGGGR
ncbi:peroxisome-assembly ATPase [Malassezia japonica]|uniref:Peroxisome-assembly ATPase n=1 Tax=Malassezia japonica TaxID=223818 RepID=A0AAF0F3H4_9BASI|nr:peroxisome-assembly ATPase [Malassezia japonica]WFD39917.1 peroxisome-assembly ATPase [Malassezia japonica]